MADNCSDFVFCGTTSGDILGVNIKKDHWIMQFKVPEKNCFSQGITALSLINCQASSFNFLIGTGDGVVGRYEIKCCLDKNKKLTATLKANNTTK